MRTFQFILLLTSLTFNVACSDDTPDKVAAPPSTPQLMPTPINGLLGFTPIALNANATKNIVLLNGGSATLEITDVQLTGYQGAGDASAFSINAGVLPADIGYNKALALPVTFTPTALGVHLAKVVVTSNAANTPSITFNVVGLASANPLPTAATLAFFPGDGLVSTTDAGELALVRFTNLGETELTIYGYGITGTDAAAFSLPSDATVPSAECSAVTCGGEVPAACQPVHVGFGMVVPLGVLYQSSTAGAHTATFSIISNDPANCPATMTLHSL